MPLPQSETPLWEPSAARAQGSLLADFSARIAMKTGQKFDGYQALWQWSVDNSAEFWSECWDFCGVIGDKGAVALRDGDQMPGAQFFPEGRLNYAENLLKRRDDYPALIFRTEKGAERILSTAELYDQVSLWAQAFKNAGIKEGDRVAGYMPNMPETIIAMLAASSLGAVWSSASPDFGVQGLVDRFGQIKPKILVAVDGYYYSGKTLDCLEKIRDAQPQIEELEKTIIVPLVNEAPDLSGLKNAHVSKDFIGQYQPSKIAFTRLPFNHPLFIMFSSGTTGKPKCIVHGQGGTLLQHLKEHKLQSDIRPGDKVFYFTTCGWMMWNWLVSGLAANACLMLYDGSPFYPNGSMLWGYAEQHKCTFFGTSAKYIDALKSENIRPVDKFDLSSVKTIASTGSPLVHESFDYVYASIKKDVHLASISGGTDIVSCFMLGNPISPVWRGELQCAGLGMAVNILNDDGEVLPEGNSGELVCLKPFPCMPVGFWDDPDGKRYHDAYFSRFPNIWCHGDWVEKTLHGGFIIHGRSDATLNPGGVRIGTAEIYRQVEQVEQVAESIAVGQDWEGDVRVVLFVRLKPGAVLDEALEKEIKTRIRTGASPRHVPAKIIAVTDIPRTKSGKITELAVRDVICGRPIRNKEALANPEALDLYKDLPQLAS
jgi:acetoacetyl-CoA synthetase